VALFFDPEKLVELLSHFMPVKKLEAVLKTSQRGMKFSGTAKELLKQLVLDMTKQVGLNRMISLLKIIELLSGTKEYELLASSGYINTYQAKDNDRVDKVFKYVFSNFTEEIQLDDIASLINMNKQAFCRYFKSRTQKTFVAFVNDIRISHACKLMADGDYAIAGLAYDCGFNSLSNFNRFFKEAKGITPREYKKMIAT
jgi:AraC-like DNA-binding protein